MLDPSSYKWPTPKRLVLSLLSSSKLKEISARECTRWGALFDIDPTAMRVALGRLVKSGLLASVSRGRYAIGDRGKILSKTARGWVLAEQRVGPWDGRWLLVHTAHLGRSNKASLNARERALTLEGFAEFYTGLWCRPANYRETPPETRDRLVDLGLEREAVVLRSDSLLGASTPTAQLWSRESLETAYQRFVQALQASMPVSYTHLTLPTLLRVALSRDAATLAAA